MIGDIAELWLRRQTRLAEQRRQLEDRLFRVHQAMVQWEDWQDEMERPLPLRRPTPTPLLSYESLKALRATLLERIAEVEVMLAGDVRRAPYSA